MGLFVWCYPPVPPWPSPLMILDPLARGRERWAISDLGRASSSQYSAVLVSIVRNAYTFLQDRRDLLLDVVFPSLTLPIHSISILIIPCVDTSTQYCRRDIVCVMRWPKLTDTTCAYGASAFHLIMIHTCTYVVSLSLSVCLLPQVTTESSTQKSLSSSSTLLLDPPPETAPHQHCRSPTALWL